MVARGSVVGSRTSECPASCRPVFCTSIWTQPVSPGEVQGSPSTAVKVNFVPSAAGESFSSISASRIDPVTPLEVVVVDAITSASRSQQSQALLQPPIARQRSESGTTSWHDFVRKRIRLWFARLNWKYPILRASGAVESGSSGNERSEQDTAAQVWKLFRIAAKVRLADS